MVHMHLSTQLAALCSKPPRAEVCSSEDECASAARAFAEKAQGMMAKLLLGRFGGDKSASACLPLGRRYRARQPRQALADYRLLAAAPAPLPFAYALGQRNQ